LLKNLNYALLFARIGRLIARTHEIDPAAVIVTRSQSRVSHRRGLASLRSIVVWFKMEM